MLQTVLLDGNRRIISAAQGPQALAVRCENAQLALYETARVVIAHTSYPTQPTRAVVRRASLNSRPHQMPASRKPHLYRSGS